MATQPDFQPDTIEPAAPPEQPITPGPDEAPAGEPDEIVPNSPDWDQPDQAPAETPPPPD